MSDPTSSRQHRQAMWVNGIMAFLGLVGLYFSATGPLSPSTLEAIPQRGAEYIQSVSQLVATYGWIFFLVVVFGNIAYWKRSHLLELYRRALTFFLHPVLSPVTHEPTSKVDAKIRYGDRVVFKHFSTGHYLSSVDGNVFRAIDGGSGQQMTFGAAIPDENSIWIIRTGHGEQDGAKVGQEAEVNHTVRIFHAATGQCLHSHSIVAPSSRGSPPHYQQREVTVVMASNTQDNWQVTTKQAFEFGTKWRFKHSDGNWYLHSHNIPIGIAGRSCVFEVTSCSDRNEDDFWIIQPSSETKVG